MIIRRALYWIHDGDDLVHTDPGGTDLLKYRSGAFAFQQETTISSTAGNIILTPNSDLAVGAAGSGKDVYFYSDTSGDHLLWDSSAEALLITGTDGQTALDVLDGDIRVVDKLYFFDRGGEYLSSDGSNLTVAGNTIFASSAEFNANIDVKRDASSTLSLFAWGGSGTRGTLVLHTGRNTEASPSAVQSDEEIGRVQFKAYGTSDNDEAGYISMRTTQIWDGSSHGSKMQFTTVPNGGTGQDTVRVEIGQDGDTSFSGNIDFTGAKSITTASGALTLAPAAGIFMNNLGTAGSGTALVIDGSNEIIPSSSSITYKDNVRDIESDSSKVFDLIPRTFAWKRDGQTDFGLIAEEVHEVIPEMVTYNRDGTPESVKYDRLSILLLMELQKIKESLEGK